MLSGPTRLFAGAQILAAMNGLTNSTGQLVSARVTGAPAIVKDTMFSAHLYLTALERHFGGVDAVVASYIASQEELQQGGQRLAAAKLSLARKWKIARRWADRATETQQSQHSGVCADRPYAVD